jgi:hypothetical protein
MTDHPFAAEADTVKRAQALPGAIAADLSLHGGVLRCEECGGQKPLGDVASYLSNGWPSHCGKTMTWVTLRALAFESREVPDGFELVAVPDEDWRIEPGKPCTRRLKGNLVCRQPSAASVNRGKMTRRGPVPAWWPYCPAHLYNRWIEDGRVWRWVLREAGEAS